MALWTTNAWVSGMSPGATTSGAFGSTLPGFAVVVVGFAALRAVAGLVAFVVELPHAAASTVIARAVTGMGLDRT